MSIYHALLESSSLTSYPLPLLTPISLTGETKLPWSSTCALNPESTPQSPPFRSPEMLEPPRNPSTSRPCHSDFGSDSVWTISDLDNSDEKVYYQEKIDESNKELKELESVHVKHKKRQEMLRNRELSDKGRKSCSNHLYESMKQSKLGKWKRLNPARSKAWRSLEVAGSSDGWNKTKITCCGFGSGVITGFGLEPLDGLRAQMKNVFLVACKQPDKRLLSSNQLIRQRALHMVGTEKFEELVVTLDGALFEKYGTMSGDSIELSNIVDMLSNIREKIPNAVRQYRAAENKVSHLEMGLAKAKERYWL
ncbi:hypothetical protein ISN44_As03g030420 [Arabidopsis suecica]|uniref:Uncharacterized protein n=1 Tax=Arabidopsis suecica TaxID=45249 RepID=A0A8T2F9X7_ARASU|nr:hypothetical protein ISN44_As03g030420 [Arabidopsis suecica]